MTVESLLRNGVAGEGDARTVTLDPRFGGLPDTAHGGSVLGLFAALAGGPPGAVRGVYHRRVPLGVPLPLRIERDDRGLALRLGDGNGGSLVDGRVGPATPPTADATPTGTTPDGATPAASAPGSSGERHPLPVSYSCFACGTRNDLGLHARLQFDGDHVMATWSPPPRFAAADGTLAPVALTTLLDETAFWLGALATGESGMTTELAVSLHAPIPLGPPITVRAVRADARPQADDPRRWVTRMTALLPGGRVAAEGEITFVAIRGAARRLAAGMLSMNDPEVLRRVFPAYLR